MVIILAIGPAIFQIKYTRPKRVRLTEIIDEIYVSIVRINNIQYIKVIKVLLLYQIYGYYLRSLRKIRIVYFIIGLLLFSSLGYKTYNSDNNKLNKISGSINIDESLRKFRQICPVIIMYTSSDFSIVILWTIFIYRRPKIIETSSDGNRAQKIQINLHKSIFILLVSMLSEILLWCSIWTLVFSLRYNQVLKMYSEISRNYRQVKFGVVEIDDWGKQNNILELILEYSVQSQVTINKINFSQKTTEIVIAAQHGVTKSVSNTNSISINTNLIYDFAVIMFADVSNSRNIEPVSVTTTTSTYRSIQGPSKMESISEIAEYTNYEVQNIPVYSKTDVELYSRSVEPGKDLEATDDIELISIIISLIAVSILVMDTKLFNILIDMILFGYGIYLSNTWSILYLVVQFTIDEIIDVPGGNTNYAKDMNINMQLLYDFEIAEYERITRVQERRNIGREKIIIALVIIVLCILTLFPPTPAFIISTYDLEEEEEEIVQLLVFGQSLVVLFITMLAVRNPVQPLGCSYIIMYEYINQSTYVQIINTNINWGTYAKIYRDRDFIFYDILILVIILGIAILISFPTTYAFAIIAYDLEEEEIDRCVVKSININSGIIGYDMLVISITLYVTVQKMREDLWNEDEININIALLYDTLLQPVLVLRFELDANTNIQLEDENINVPQQLIDDRKLGKLITFINSSKCYEYDIFENETLLLLMDDRNRIDEEGIKRNKQNNILMQMICELGIIIILLTSELTGMKLIVKLVETVPVYSEISLNNMITVSEATKCVTINGINYSEGNINASITPKLIEGNINILDEILAYDYSRVQQHSTLIIVVVIFLIINSGILSIYAKYALIYLSETYDRIQHEDRILSEVINLNQIRSKIGISIISDLLLSLSVEKLIICIYVSLTSIISGIVINVGFNTRDIEDNYQQKDAVNLSLVARSGILSIYNINRNDEYGIEYNYLYIYLQIKKKQIEEKQKITISAESKNCIKYGQKLFILLICYNYIILVIYLIYPLYKRILFNYILSNYGIEYIERLLIVWILLSLYGNYSTTCGGNESEKLIVEIEIYIYFINMGLYYKYFTNITSTPQQQSISVIRSCVRNLLGIKKNHMEFQVDILYNSEDLCYLVIDDIININYVDIPRNQQETLVEISYTSSYYALADNRVGIEETGDELVLKSRGNDVRNDNIYSITDYVLIHELYELIISKYDNILVLVLRDILFTIEIGIVLILVITQIMASISDDDEEYTTYTILTRNECTPQNYPCVQQHLKLKIFRIIFTIIIHVILLYVIFLIEDQISSEITESNQIGSKQGPETLWLFIETNSGCLETKLSVTQTVSDYSEILVGIGYERREENKNEPVKLTNETVKLTNKMTNNIIICKYYYLYYTHHYYPQAHHSDTCPHVLATVCCTMIKLIGILIDYRNYIILVGFILFSIIVIEYIKYIQIEDEYKVYGIETIHSSHIQNSMKNTDIILVQLLYIYGELIGKIEYERREEGALGDIMSYKHLSSLRFDGYKRILLNYIILITHHTVQGLDIGLYKLCMVSSNICIRGCWINYGKVRSEIDITIH